MKIRPHHLKVAANNKTARATVKGSRRGCHFRPAASGTSSTASSSSSSKEQGSGSVSVAKRHEPEQSEAKSHCPTSRSELQVEELLPLEEPLPRSPVPRVLAQVRKSKVGFYQQRKEARGQSEAKSSSQVSESSAHGFRMWSFKHVPAVVLSLTIGAELERQQSGL